MFKRLLAFTLAIALFATMWLMPTTATTVEPTSSAPDISAEKIADFDFSEGTWKEDLDIEIAGDSGMPSGYKDSDEIGMKVALIPFATQMKFKTNPKTRTFSNFTVEFYAKITTDAETDVRLITVGNNGNGATGLYEENGQATFSLPDAYARMDGRFPRKNGFTLLA